MIAAMDTLSDPDHGHGGDADRQPDHTLTIEEAAAALGLCITAVRRRIRAGQLAAVKVDGAHGPEYRVSVGDGGHGQAATVATAPSRGNGHGGHADNPGLDSLVALVRDLTADNRRLQDERAELYGRLGFYQAKVAELEQRLLLAAPAPTSVTEDKPAEASPTPPQPLHQRRWWRFWLRPAAG
jgi:hypothetical protein